MRLYFIMNMDTLGLVADLESLDEVEVCDKECAYHDYMKSEVKETLEKLTKKKNGIRYERAVSNYYNQLTR